jgi:glutathione S-transferase
MKTLVVCLDGTDQYKTQKAPRHPTNIARMFDALGGQAAEAGYGSWETTNGDVAGKYLPGVGTQEGSLQVLGDLFGDGLPELIVRGYTFLSRAWAPGDRLVISGFSRGATAARALAGMVVARGLLRQQDLYDADDKEAAYEHGIAAWYLHRHAVLPADLLRREALKARLERMGRRLPDLGPGDFTAAPEIEAVAVFDTVSSLGVPHFADHKVHFDFEIIDRALSPKVKRGFHALAADETREIFSPTYWDARDGVEQVIFAGCHSNVGGGFPDIALSDIALGWMLDKLAEVGVPTDRALIDPAVNGRFDGLIQDDARGWPMFGLFCQPRRFPLDAKPHRSLIDRWNLDPDRIRPHRQPSHYQAAGVYIGDRPLHP